MNKHEEMVMKTRKNILNSFIELWKEKGLENITIGALTKRAHLNRGTFYKYFDDIYDLMNHLEDETILFVKESINERFQNGLPEDFDEFSAGCAQIFAQNESTLMLLLNLPTFTNKLKQELVPLFMAKNPLLNNTPYPEYIEVYVFSTMTEMVKYWYYHDRQMDLKELFHLMQSLVLNGIMLFSNTKSFKDIQKQSI